MKVQTSLTIAIASGKGGTGKTTVATNLAYALKDQMNLQLIDCDVEEPNAYLFLQPIIEEGEQVTIPVPTIDQSKCISCGKCRDLCVYNAITLIANQVLAFPELCHGCGGCSYICPVEAIREEARPIGEVERGYFLTRSAESGLSVNSTKRAKEAAENIGGQFLHGRSKVGNPLTPPIIKKLKSQIVSDRLTILDAPPGTSCPVVSTLREVDYVVLVTEPTPFGLHDLKLTVEVVRKLEIPFGVIINRAGLGDGQVVKYCQEEQISILMQIPFRREYATCYAEGEMLVEHDPGLASQFRQMYQRILRERGDHS